MNWILWSQLNISILSPFLIVQNWHSKSGPIGDMMVSFTQISLPYLATFYRYGELVYFDFRFVILLNVNSFRYDLSSSSKLVKRKQSLFLSINEIGHKIGNQEARDWQISHPRGSCKTSGAACFVSSRWPSLTPRHVISSGGLIS